MLHPSLRTNLHPSAQDVHPSAGMPRVQDGVATCQRSAKRSVRDGSGGGRGSACPGGCGPSAGV
eukprot:4871589-Pleurochrysis_carterae.AAC.1